MSGTFGLPEADLAGLLPLTVRIPVLEALLRTGTMIRRGERVMHRDARGEQAGQVLAVMASALAAAPWRGGVPREAIQTRLKLPLKTVMQVLEELERHGEVRHRGKLWTLAAHEPVRDAAQVEADRIIGERIVAERFLSETEAVTGLGLSEAIARDFLEERIEAGEAVKLGQGLLVSAAAFADALDRLRGHFRNQPQITAAEARDLLGTNRKTIIPFLELLDTSGLTRRGSDFRIATAALMGEDP
jgi:selenocysteine-specific elongation factor